jgi:hypothetical protein
MPRRPTYALAIAVFCLLSWTATDQGEAKVVRDGRGSVSNPAVQTGGIPLPPHEKPPAIPYSLIGAIASEGYWMSQYPIWPWQQFEALSWFRNREPFEGLRPLSFLRFRHQAKFFPIRFRNRHH